MIDVVKITIIRTLIRTKCSSSEIIRIFTLINYVVIHDPGAIWMVLNTLVRSKLEASSLVSHPIKAIY